MKCIVPSQNVKIISRAIHSLAKIGEEMFVEATEESLLFRTINMAQSAFAEFKMNKSFFSSFLYNSSEDSEAKCKITMKSCLSVFKSPHSLDKQVENCEIRFKPEGTVIIFQLKFTNSSTKKYFLPVIDCEAVEASFKKDDCNLLAAPSKFLASCLKNFRHSEDEITFSVSQEKMIIKNHLELSRDVNLMRTELSFQPSEFDSYTINNPTKVTFCLKELRAVLMFAEPSNLPVAMSFSNPGSPIVLQVINHPVYEANYVVSTLHPRDMSRDVSSSSTNSSRVNHRASVNTPLVQEPRTPEVAIPPKTPTSNKRKLSVDHGDLFDFQTEDTPGTVTNLNRTLPLDDAVLSGSEVRLTTDGDFQQDTELPSHVSHLVETVFARCFRKRNDLDFLPGNNIVLSQNSEANISLKNLTRKY